MLLPVELSPEGVERAHRDLDEVGAIVTGDPGAGEVDWEGARAHSGAGGGRGSSVMARSSTYSVSRER